MLLQFNFKNFKSFRNETSLDMTAANITEFPEHIASIGGERVLPITAIYGPNASGKSNVCEAFGYMRDMVISSFRLSGLDSNQTQCSRFFFGEKRESESSFEVFFVLAHDGRERVVNYGFCISDDVITEEWLTFRAKTSKEGKCVFYRNGREGEQQLDLSGIEKAYRENIEVSLGNDALLLSLGNSLLVPELKSVYGWFARGTSVSFGRNVRLPRSRFERWFRRNQDKETAVLKYLATFDDSISNIKVIEYEESAHDGCKFRSNGAAIPL